MKTTFLRGFFLLALLGPVLSASADVASELTGKLVTLRGKAVIPYAATELPQAQYIALYFSAGWCGPCHQFTPELVKFYHEMKPKYPGFEVIFMSRDQSPNDMEKYMAEMQMPWPGMRFSAAKSDRALNKYCGSGIPCLVVLNEKGEVLSDSFVGKEYVGPYRVMNDLKRMLSDGPASAATATAAASATTLTSAGPAKNTVQSPSGTDWNAAFKKKP
ncbi:MAG: thioredoxin-like domain-containing protein [Chthoniobacterales bacterium]